MLDHEGRAVEVRVKSSHLTQLASIHADAGSTRLRRLSAETARLIAEALSIVTVGEASRCQALAESAFMKAKEMASLGDASLLPEAWAALGVAAMYQGDLRRSAASYWRAWRASRSIDRKGSDYLRTLAYLYRRLWEVEKERKYYEKYLRFSCEDSNRKQAVLFHLSLGRLYLERCALEETEAHVWQALRLLEGVPAEMTESVRSSLMDGCVQEAVEKLESLLERRP